MKTITLNIPDHKCECIVSQNEHLQSKVWEMGHNPQAGVYQNVKEFFESSCDPGHEEDDFLDREDYLRAIDKNELWTIQWYPRTPVGFCRIYASSIEKLNEAILKKYKE